MLPRRPDASPSFPKPIRFPTAALGLWTLTPDTPDGYERLFPNPPRLMLPVGRTRSLTMRTPGSGEVVVANADAHGIIPGADGRPCCRAVMLNKMLVLEGLQAGWIWVELRQGSASLDIQVSVKNEVVVPVIAHYVEHGPHLKTRMTRTLLQEMIGVANGILTPQANVKIALDRDRDLTHATIGQRLGRTVKADSETGGGEWDLLTGFAERTGARRLLNLFLVRRFEIKDGDPRGDLAGTAGGCCVFEDQFKAGGLDADAGSTLAHEVGHHLGLHHVPETTNLMYESQPRGDRLTRLQADALNSSGTLIDPFAN